MNGLCFPRLPEWQRFEIDTALKSILPGAAARRWIGCASALSVVLVCSGAGTPPVEEPLGNRIPLGFVMPFLLLLLAIAILPAAARDWWQSNLNKAKVAAFFSLPVIVMFAFHFGEIGNRALLHQMTEYASFIMLLAALYVISGGILIEGAFRGTPQSNTLLLAIGAVLANLIGTTGASLLLVRPLIRGNRHRRRVVQVPVFFIFIVANCGGLLTPLGDPPLFLGFLKGVPFEWTLRLFPQWIFVNGSLLVIFAIWDWMASARDQREGATSTTGLTHARFGLRGAHNFAFLAGVMALLFAAGRGYGNAGDPWPFGLQEGGLLVLAVASFFSTRHEIREKNQATFGPIIEVALLFAGIFVTITPAVLLLDAKGSRLGIHEPWQFFWAAGLMSSVLDNAPAYLTAVVTACGSAQIPIEGRYLETFLELRKTGGADQILSAISCGCVFMGALTYLGNAPNFMVRAHAEESNMRMPSFFGFMLYSCAILLPLFGVVTFVFFRA
ncbi:MAG TPA: sodium:proton antiporter [Planctomycetaceae bacterium]|jgi:Na+/H+ antiporter NhaD/arsenite permease-like protein|nr:sodium:proton antiporter [Planctomycetaceae bacterium]